MDYYADVHQVPTNYEGAVRPEERDLRDLLSFENPGFEVFEVSE